MAQLAGALTEKWRLGQRARLKMEDLEQLVRERTRELEDANAQLRDEVRARAEAQERIERQKVQLEREVAQRRIAENDSIESEMRYRTLVELSPEAVLVLREG